MEKQKFVVRLMTEPSDEHPIGEMLAWGQSLIKPKAGGSFHVARTQLLVMAAGLGHHLSVHWCDLDVVRTEPLMSGGIEVSTNKIGTVANFDWLFKSVWKIESEDKGHLPPVTVSQDVVFCPVTAVLVAVGESSGG